MMKINKLSLENEKYLQGWDCIDPQPQALYSIGSLPDKRLKTVAIVGSRKPTSYGIEVTHKLAYELAKASVVIVSGLALGTDSYAHKGALEAGGLTLAVLAGGLDKIYPTSNKNLADQIIRQGGAILSEYPAGTPPMQYRFLERNRIVSGISDLIIIVEAASRSGTLSTARWALQQGKTVMAVPGNITSLNSVGCNTLIRQGAEVVTGSKDVIELLNITPETAQATLFAATKEEQLLLNLMTKGIRDGETLQVQSGLSPDVFNQTLTMMEIQGTIRALGANQWGLR
jgi:DNA processing protein